MTSELLIMCYSYPPDQEYHKKRFNSVMIIQCETNKAKDYTFTLIAKQGLKLELKVMVCYQCGPPIAGSLFFDRHL